MSVLDVTTNTTFHSLSAAIIASQANDVIQITGGTYVENFPSITHSLTIEAVHGMASLSSPQPEPINGRAILNVPLNRNVSLTVSGLILHGAANADGNAAGILFEIGNGTLTVRDCWITGNQDGILTGGVSRASTHGMTVTIDHSEIDDNGVAPLNPRYGFAHNLYIGAVSQLTVSNSYVHAALGGHEIKSRALTSVISGNRIVDGPHAGTSYSIDLPDGGIGVISGNVIEKGPLAANRYVIHFAGEGGVTYPNSTLVVENNTVVSDRLAAVAVYNQSEDRSGRTIPAAITGNTLYNIPRAALVEDAHGGAADTVSGNSFDTGAAPPLDTAHPFQVPTPVPEPPGVSILPLALLATAILRHCRQRRAPVARCRSATA